MPLDDDIEVALFKLLNPDAPTPDADPSFVVPTQTEAGTMLEGWRAWRIHVPEGRLGPGETPYLHSVAHNYHWHPRRESIAECNKKGEPADIPHGGSHGCGFYSAKNLKHLLGMGYPEYTGSYYNVIGQVANSGNVIEGTLGWRAQKSYPVSLFCPYEIPRMAGPIEEAYGVPVFLLNWLDKPVSEVYKAVTDLIGPDGWT